MRETRAATAEDLKHHRKVAVKVLRSELAAERFLKEIHVAANLQHPHILPLFDSGEADGFLYYVMPLIETWLPFRDLANVPSSLQRYQPSRGFSRDKPPGKGFFQQTLDFMVPRAHSVHAPSCRTQ